MTQTQILLGLDFEAELLRDGEVVAADSLRPRTRYVGVDGSGWQVEFRPAPASDPRVLYSRAIRLARAFERKEKNIRLLLSGHTYPLGAHIHVSIDKRINADEANRLVRTVDDTPTPLGPVGELLCRLSGDARGDYRRRAAYRYDKPHGGIEYRTPPSLIMLSPDLFVWLCELIARTAAHVCNVATPPATPTDFPADEARRLLSIRDRLVGLEGPLECVPEFVLSDGDIWSDAWRLAVDEWNSCAAWPRVRLRMFAFRAQRGLVTTWPAVAERYGWAVIDWNSPWLGVPYEARTSWGEGQVWEFLEYVAQLFIEGRR